MPVQAGGDESRLADFHAKIVRAPELPKNDPGFSLHCILHIHLHAVIMTPGTLYPDRPA